MDAQQQDLRRAIDKEKWYLSEQAGHDVGFEVAADHFFGHHLDGFARQFRVNYCRIECPARERCRLAPYVDAMPSISEMTRQQEREDEAQASSA